MRTTILASIAALSLALPVACGGGSSTTGSGGSSSTGDMTTTSGGGTGGVLGSAGGGGAGPDCGGVLAAGDCDTCGKAGCCQAIAACKATAGCVACYGDDTLCTAENQPAASELLVCLQAACATECALAPPVGDATCSVAPSPTGSCVTLGATVQCNPVTNAPCNTDAGEACDLSTGGGFECYPLPNNAELCQPCGMEGALCKGGLTCIGICARYCCDDADCGAGKCDKATYKLGDFGVGVCLGGN